MTQFTTAETLNRVLMNQSILVSSDTDKSGLLVLLVFALQADPSDQNTISKLFDDFFSTDKIGGRREHSLKPNMTQLDNCYSLQCH